MIKKNFTLIELLTVAFILAIVVGVSIASYKSIEDSSRVKNNRSRDG